MKRKMMCFLLAWAFAASIVAHSAPIERSAKLSPTSHTHVPGQGAHEAWVAFPGQSLRDTVDAWSSKAGYELVWDADYDFPIRAGVRLDGDFIPAVTNLFNAYAAADRPLSVDIFKEQKLIRVQARGE